MVFNFRKRRRSAAVALLALAALAGCGKDSTGPSAGPATLDIVTAPPATATAGLPVTGPTIKVTDASGNPVAGARVDFSVTAGGGSVQNPMVITDANGVASAGAWQIGTAGSNTLTASVAGVQPVTFTTTAQYGAGTQLIKTRGDNQIGHLNTTLPTPLTVKLVSAGGLGIPNQQVTFTVTTGGGSISNGTAVTDANGFATSGAWTLGPNFGLNTVVAQAGSLSATFRAVVDPCEDRTALSVGQSVSGTLVFDAAKCAIGGAATDRYLLNTGNEAVLITLSSSDFDALLNVSNAAGTIPIATNDNSPAGGTTNSEIRLIAASGTKTVDATTAAAGKTGAYTLGVASTSADVAGCQRVYLQVGATTQQNLQTTDCKNAGFAADEFIVYLQAGTPYRIRQVSTVAGVLDSYVYLLSPTGAVVAEDDDSGGGGNSTIASYTPTTSGFYTIRSSSYGNAQNDPYGKEYGAFTLTVDIP